MLATIDTYTGFIGFTGRYYTGCFASISNQTALILWLNVHSKHKLSFLCTQVSFFLLGLISHTLCLRLVTQHCQYFPSRLDFAFLLFLAERLRKCAMESRRLGLMVLDSLIVEICGKMGEGYGVTRGRSFPAMRGIGQEWGRRWSRLHVGSSACPLAMHTQLHLTTKNLSTYIKVGPIKASHSFTPILERYNNTHSKSAIIEERLRKEKKRKEKKRKPCLFRYAHRPQMIPLDCSSLSLLTPRPAKHAG